MVDSLVSTKTAAKLVGLSQRHFRLVAEFYKVSPIVLGSFKHYWKLSDLLLIKKNYKKGMKLRVPRHRKAYERKKVVD